MRRDAWEGDADVLLRVVVGPEHPLPLGHLLDEAGVHAIAAGCGHRLRAGPIALMVLLLIGCDLGRSTVYENFATAMMNVGAGDVDGGRLLWVDSSLPSP